MNLIGKMYMSAVCPLCNFTFCLDRSEYQYVDQQVEKARFDENLIFHPSIFEERLQFFCPECGKTIKSYRYGLVNYTNETVNLLTSEMEKRKR